MKLLLNLGRNNELIQKHKDYSVIFIFLFLIMEIF